jgi:hypothetical protein
LAAAPSYFEIPVQITAAVQIGRRFWPDTRHRWGLPKPHQTPPFAEGSVGTSYVYRYFFSQVYFCFKKFLPPAPSGSPNSLEARAP